MNRSMNMRFSLQGYMQRCISGAVMIITFLLAILRIGNLSVLNFWGVLFAFSLFYFTISLNSDSRISFANLIKNNQPRQAGVIFSYSMLLGLAYEIIGLSWLKLWYYPPGIIPL